MVRTVFRVISVRKNTREKKKSLPLSLEYWENKACSTSGPAKSSLSASNLLGK